MSDIRLEISVKEENLILFKRCIRKLLESTFIIGEKDEKLYSFISRESNRQDISDYLRMTGLDVLVDMNVRIAMLRPYEADEETPGLKNTNIIRFSGEQYHTLLVLWEIYLETLGYSNENTVSMGDFIDRLKIYEVDADKRSLAATLKLFKKYELINFDPKENSEDALITLYPSLQFGWDIEQFKTISDEYIKRSSGEQDIETEEED